MAPRRKRAKAKPKSPRRTRITARTATPEESEEPAFVDNIEEIASGKSPAQRKTRTASTHKKFGKFRCLLETENNSDITEEDVEASVDALEETSEDESQEVVETEEVALKESIEMDINEISQEKLISENVSIPESAIILHTDDSVTVDLGNELSLQSSEMEYTETEGENQESVATEEVVDQLSNLNFNTVETVCSENQEINAEETVEDPTKLLPNEVFNVDCIQPEFTVECVSEEVIPVLGEQEIEIGIASDVDAVNEISDGTEEIEEPAKEKTSEVIEQSLVIDTIEQEGNTVQPPSIKTAKSRNTRSSQQKKPKVVPTRKKSSPSVRTNKKEPRTKSKGKKGTDKINLDTNQGSAALENSVRRSSRIKSISVLKLRSKGQGLVKPKTDIEVKKPIKGNSNDSDASENSNSGHTDSEKTSSDSPSFLTPSSGYESDHKPVKVKSRWRRSSELEMGNSTVANNTKSSTSPVSEGVQSQPAVTVPTHDDKTEDVAASDDIRNRLKQFVHLKENQYLTSRIICKEAKKMFCDCFLTTEEVERGELACGEDCLNRLLMIECGPLCPVNDRCTNKRFQKSQFSPCEVFRTEKKGLGIRATANISFGEFILEYIGEVIGPDEFEERATEYSKGKNPHYYFMSLRADAVIDATQKGNISRFINHSCEPNAETQKWTVNGELRIGFFSKRTILAGEEITFDYQFQRYGKEAQKCFCEASTCRGWLGEEPDEDDEEEEEEEEEEGEEEEESEEVVPVCAEKEEQTVQKEFETLTTQVIEEMDEKPTIETETPVETVNDVAAAAVVDVPVIAPVVETEVINKPVKKEKRKIIKRKVLIKDIFDDVDVDEEIDMLITTGLKNQAHTLKLSRLMVRANEAPQRTALLRILRHGEFPCRRLFLDYHGLRLIHGWMNDAQQKCKIDKKQESLRLELLQTLATLPIPNKTMLQDSKVLLTVEMWSVKLEDVSTGLDSESNSPKVEIDSTAAMESDVTEMHKSSEKIYAINGEENRVKIKEEDQMETVKKEADPEENVQMASVTELAEEEIRKSVGMDIERIRSKNQWCIEHSDKKIVQDIIDMFDDDMDISPIAFNEDDNIIEIKEVIKQPEEHQPDYEVEITALALKLLEEWSGLKEVFRIPKKERIEQMKEHEREANRGYKAGLEHDADRRSRYRKLTRHRYGDKTELYERIRKGLKSDDRALNSFSRINKHERRKLFAMQVEQQEIERRFKKRDMWRQHEFNCMAVGADPRFSAPFDPSHNYQCMWNQQTGQWQNYPMNMNHGPMLNPRFNPPMPYPYNSGGAVPPLPNMPPPSSIPMPVSSMPHPMPNPHTVPNMGHPTNFPHPPANMPHPSNMPRPPINMPHPPTSMALPPTNMPPPPSNMLPPPTNMPLPPNMPPPPVNMPHPANMSHMPPNIHPPLNMSHPPPNIQHMPPPMSHPQQNVPHPNFSQIPNMPHPSLNISISNIPTNVPPPLPNIPLPSNNQIHQPLPNNTNMTSMSNNPVNNMPPLSSIPPLPNVPPPSNMQQMPPVSYQEDKATEKEDLSQVKFAGPIPPPAKLPPRWKCAKDKYGRPYYYHIKIRVSQWEPPEFPSPVEVEEESSDTTSSSETSSLSSDSSSEDSEDDELDDTKLLLEIRKKFQQMDSVTKTSSTPSAVTEQQEVKEFSPDDSSLLKNQDQFDDTNDSIDFSKATSLDERLKEEFNLSRKESHRLEPAAKKKRLGLVTEVHIISPRTEEDKMQAKENLRKYKENKQKLKRQKLLGSSGSNSNSSSSTTQSKKRVKVTVKNPAKSHKSTVKTKLKEVMDMNTEGAKKIKEAFRSSMAGVMVNILNPYRKPDCKEGRIINTEDFKHLARKLTHFVMLKELKHCQNIEDLTCTESVKSKAKEFVRKYMSKFGETYMRPKDDLDY